MKRPGSKEYSPEHCDLGHIAQGIGAAPPEWSW